MFNSHKTLQGKYCFADFTKAQTEAQRGWDTWLKIMQLLRGWSQDSNQCLWTPESMLLTCQMIEWRPTVELQAWIPSRILCPETSDLESFKKCCWVSSAEILIWLAWSMTLGIRYSKILSTFMSSQNWRHWSPWQLYRGDRERRETWSNHTQNEQVI